MADGSEGYPFYTLVFPPIPGFVLNPGFDLLLSAANPIFIADARVNTGWLELVEVCLSYLPRIVDSSSPRSQPTIGPT